MARIVNAQGQLFDPRWASGLTNHSRTRDRAEDVKSESLLVLGLVVSTQKWIHQRNQSL